MPGKIITVEVVLKVETDKAYGFDTGANRKDAYGSDVLTWIPKSQCEYDATDKTLQLPEWLAIRAGLV